MTFYLIHLVRMPDGTTRYGLLNYDPTKKTQPTVQDEASLLMALKQGVIQIQNMALVDDKLTIVGGSRDTYSVVDARTGTLITEPKFIYLGMSSDGRKATIAHPSGVVSAVPIPLLCKKYKMANIKMSSSGLPEPLEGEFEATKPVKTARNPSSDPLEPVLDPSIPSPQQFLDAHDGSDEVIEIATGDLEAKDSPYFTEEERMRYVKGVFRISNYTEEGLEWHNIPDKINPEQDCCVKLLRAITTMKVWSPVCYAVLTSVSPIATRKIDTAAVSIKHLLINPDFLAEMPESELLFTLYHEVYHLMLRHTLRRRDRDPERWNVACDLIVNAAIAAEFGAASTKGKLNKGETVTINVGNAPLKEISLPSWVLFEDTIDTNMTDVEEVYDKLKVETSNMNASGQGQGQDSSDGSSNGSGQGSGQGDDDAKGNAGNGSGQGSQEAKDSQGNKDNSQTEQQGKDIGKQKKIHYTFGTGPTKTAKMPMDVFDDKQDIPNAENGYKMLMSRHAVQNAINRSNSGIGNLVTEHLKRLKSPFVNWRKYLDNCLSKETEATYSLSHPDRRFVKDGLYVPGPYQENNHLKDLIIGIDTSGSMSDEDLGIAAGHIYNIFAKYKVNAHIVYWDTKVHKVEKLNKRTDIVRMKPEGGGGTRASCFIEWLKKNTRGGRKAYDPCAIIIITDGGIEGAAEMAPLGPLSRKLVWLVTQPYIYRSFKPAYGVKAVLRDENL